jgi:acyl dehydratase
LGLFYEDFSVGDSIETPGRTVTESDVVSFAGLSGDFNPLHTDAQFAAQSPFGQRIAHGLLVVAFVSGLLGRLSLFDGTGLAFVELHWKFLLPVFFGDTLHVRQSVSYKHETKSLRSGMVTFQIDVLNQKEQVVQTGERVLKLARRPVQSAIV